MKYRFLSKILNTYNPTVIKHLKVRLYVIGNGRYKSKLQKLILDYDLNLNIILVDYQDISYMYSYACNSDFLFMSLKSDEIFSNTLPAKIQTYMCIGKPILAMINGEANSLINNSKIGITWYSVGFDNYFCNDESSNNDMDVVFLF